MGVRAAGRGPLASCASERAAQLLLALAALCVCPLPKVNLLKVHIAHTPRSHVQQVSQLCGHCIQSSSISPAHWPYLMSDPQLRLAVKSKRDFCCQYPSKMHHSNYIGARCLCVTEQQQIYRLPLSITYDYR